MTERDERDKEIAHLIRNRISVWEENARLSGGLDAVPQVRSVIQGLRDALAFVDPHPFR